MKKLRKKEKENQKTIAKERIERLFKQASDVFAKNPARAHRYVQLAWKIAMRYNVRVPKELKMRYCRECHSFLVPGKNSIVRIASGSKSLTVKCLECGHIARFPYRKEQQKHRTNKTRQRF